MFGRTLSALPGNREHAKIVIQTVIPRAAAITVAARIVQPSQVRDAPAPSNLHVVLHVPRGHHSVRRSAARACRAEGAPDLPVEVTPDRLAGGGDAKVVAKAPRGLGSACTCVLHDELEGNLGEGVERMGFRHCCGVCAGLGGRRGTQ